MRIFDRAAAYSQPGRSLRLGGHEVVQEAAEITQFALVVGEEPVRHLETSFLSAQPLDTWNLPDAGSIVDTKMTCSSS